MSSYDVFINFRGEDRRKTFVSHLYGALTNAGVNTFLDDEELRKGEEQGPAALKRAIEGSHISIVVLSPNYAQSRWCLNELVHIMECKKTYGQMVIPVFYDVEPSFVRKQMGDFGEAWRVTARQKEDMFLLSKWMEALTQVVDISGWDANNFW
jgi:hypothetical protein